MSRVNPPLPPLFRFLNPSSASPQGLKADPEVDEYVEKLRDEIMDKAIEVIGDRGSYDEEVLKLSFGEEIDRVLMEREKAAKVRCAGPVLLHFLNQSDVMRTAGGACVPTRVGRRLH